MPHPIFVPPGGAGAKFTPPSEEMLRIRDKCVTIWNTLDAIRKHSVEREHEAAVDFFGRIRALSGMVGLLAEQPGCAPNDPVGQAERARMVPLKQKMDEITQKLNSTVNLTDPLPYTAPKRVEWMGFQAHTLANILLDPANAKDIEAIGADPTLSYETKAVFFDWVGHFLNDAMAEVVKNKKHEEEIFSAVTKTLDSRSTKNAIGACLWSIQMTASSAGNLPGPNTLYVGVVRIRAVLGLKELASRAPAAILGELLPHWFTALDLSQDERAGFEKALTRFKSEVDSAAKSSTEVEKNLSNARAQKIYENELKPIAKKGGSPQSGPRLSGAMTVLNIICLVDTWKSLPDSNKTLRNIGDIANAGILAGSSFVVTLSRIKRSIPYMTKFVEHPYVGAGIGLFAGFVAIIDGVDTLFDALNKTKADPWIVASGGLQVSAGAAIVYGVLFASPGFQLVGVLLGVAAGAASVASSLLKDPMVAFFEDLLENIKKAECKWDKSLIMRNVGLSTLLSELEGLVYSTGVQILLYNHGWTENGLRVGKDRLLHRLDELGIKDPLHREELIKFV
jgi:hypothetical protein